MIAAMFNQVTTALLICFLVFTFPSLAPEAAAQGVWDKTKEGVKKGGEGVKKGAETAVEKTREGAEKAGSEVKDVFTDDDDQDQTADPAEQTVRPETLPPDTAPQDDAMETDAPESEPAAPEADADADAEADADADAQAPSQSESDEELPDTGGGLPILALSGALAMAAAGLSRIVGAARNK